MKKVLWVVILGLSVAAVAAQQAKLPVFYLRYSGGFGAEELEEDDALEPASTRSSVSLRIKEEFSRALVTNLTLFYSNKDYYDDDAGDYDYFYVKPELALDITDRLTLETQLRSKWVRYPASDSRDTLQLSSAVAATYEPARGTRVTASLGGGLDLYDDDSRDEQSGVLGVRILSRLDAVTVGGSYRGTLYTPLGASSVAERSLLHEVGVTLTWDPNR